MRTVFYTIFFIYSSFLVTSAHPIHVSVVNMDYIADSNKMEFSVRLFYDDFQSLINYKYNTMLNFKNLSRMTTKEQHAVTDYIDRNFIITDGQQHRIPVEFTGWKLEDFSVWLFFNANPKDEISSITLQNTIMLDLFSDQVNLVILQLGDIQNGFEFNKRTTTHTYIP